MKISRKWICCGFLLGCYIATNSEAAELTPTYQDHALGVSLTAMPFPDTLSRDLSSGFETRLVVRIVLSSQGKAIDGRDATVSIKYDLWEERFALKSDVAGQPTNTVTLKQVTDVMRTLNDLHFDGLFPITPLPLNQDAQLSAELSINPIEREKMDRVRQWVATNSVPTDAVRVNPSEGNVTPQPNALFNKIFDQYIRGENVVAPWKVTVTSKPFRPAQLDPGHR